MWCGWLVLAASIGQTAPAAPPAAPPRVVILPPITAATQPAAVPPATAPAAPTQPTAPTAQPVAAAPATQPVARIVLPATTAPAVPQPPATQPSQAVAVIPPPATQPADADQAAQTAQAVAALMRQVQGATAPATQPDAAMVLPALSGQDVVIEVLPDGSLFLQGNPQDVEVLQQFMRQLQRQAVPPLQVQIFPLKNARATDIATILERFWRESKVGAGRQIAPEDRITIIPEPRSNSLMIGASAKNLTEVQALVEKLDTSTPTVTFHTIQLKHIKADEAARTITTVLGNRQRNVVGTPLFEISPDMRTNSLLVSASPSDLEQIRGLVDLIDVEPTPEAGAAVKLAIYSLQKAVATELVSVLRDMLTTGQGAAAAQEQIRRLQLEITRRNGDPLKLPSLNLEKPIKLLADTGTNSVIVASVEANLPAIGELIKILDQMPLSEEILVRIYPLDHADPQTLMTSIRDLFTQGKNVTDVPGKTQVVGRTPENLPGQGLVFNIAMSFDARTNALVVAGRPEQLLLIEQIVKAVDVPSEVGRFVPRIVQLEHTDVTKLSAALKQIVDSRQQILREKGGATAASREQVLLIPDPRTNSLIIVAKDDNFREMADLARQLDTRSADYLGQIHIINLDKLNAADLAPKLRELWTGRERVRREGELTADQPVITTDSRSNSLIIASNRDDFEVISKLVNELEQQRLSPIAQIRTVKVEHTDTTKVADMLRKLFEERAKMKPAGQENVLEDRVAVVEDPLSKMLFIASTQSNYDEIVRLISQIDVQPVVNGIIRTFFIKNADVTKAAEMIREMFDKGIIYPGGGDRTKLPESLTKVTIVSDVRSSAILVSASPENMLLIDDILKQIDRVDTPMLQAEARFFQLQNADVLRVADMLDQLFEGMRSTSPEIQEQLQMKVVPNTQTNTLALSGSRLALKRAAELIPLLDTKSEPGGTTSETQVYELKHAPAPRLAQVLTELFEKQEQGAAGKVTPINIIGDEASNSLIVTAPRNQHDRMRGLLASLDVPSAIKNQIHVIQLNNARPEQVAETLTELLRQQAQGAGQQAPLGFAITPEPRTGSLVVFAPPDMMANIRSIVEELDTSKPGRQMAMRVYPLKNQRAEDLQKLLDEFFKAAGLGDTQEARQMIINFVPIDPATGKPMINPDTGVALIKQLVHQDITVSADPNTNSLMVLAPADSIDMMAMLVEMLDSVTPVTATLQLFPLLNADATEMKSLLDDLFKPATGAGEGQRQIVLAGEGGAPAAPAAAPGAPNGGVSEVVFGVDQRTNSLIAAGSPSYLKIVETLVLQLDYKEIEERIVRVVHLRNAKAEDVATTMEAYFEQESQAVEEAAEGEAAPRRLQRHVTITDSGETANSLLLSYSPRMESQIISMINELDQPPPQVMIQVLMAEVTLNDRFEMGMEFALQDLLFSENATVRQTPNGPIIQGDHFDTIFGTDIGAAGSGSGLNFTITGEDFNFLFHALQTEGRLEVLSRPSILVRDNQEATFNVGERVPTVQDIVVSSAGVVTPSVTYEEVGVILGVTPIINPDGFVNLDIEPEISAIGTSSVTVSTGVTLPTFTQRKVETSVTVKDGETIIIGGLITSQENSSETKLPLAGDVPILGWAFRASTRSTTKTELLIVLTPHVIRDPTQARAVSIHMRDQTGLNDNIRQSPLMQGLQVLPEDDQFGPIEPIRPGGTTEPYTPAPLRSDEQGPELEEYGPPVSSLTPADDDDDLAFGPVINRRAQSGVTAAAR